jgi:hypothetical protein
MGAVVVKSKPVNLKTFGAVEHPNVTSVYQRGNRGRVFQSAAAIGAGG